MSETQSVNITGDKAAFISKQAIIRFKRVLRKCEKDQTLDPAKYFKEDNVFKFKLKDDVYYVDIMNKEQQDKEEKKMVLRQRLRDAKYNRSNKNKQKLNSLKRCIPKKIFQSYHNLIKQFNFNVPSPDEVINDPSKYTTQISTITGNIGQVSNDSKADIALKRYFSSLGDFLGIEPMNMNLRQDNTQTQLSNIELAGHGSDTEDEDGAPELI